MTNGENVFAMSRLLHFLDRWALRYALLSGAILGALTLPISLRAQAVAEAAGGNSAASAATVGAKPVTIPTLPGKKEAGSFQHVLASSVEPGEEANRKTLEGNSGMNASKLLVRASTSNCQIWVNGRPVGKAPMLLVLAPGKYQIELRGSRSEHAEQTVDLLPRETRELAVKMEKRYPSHYSVR